MFHAGDFIADDTVEIPFNTNALAGESITMGTNGAIRIYKNGSTTERSSSSGITFSEDYDGVTGPHLIRIDLGDNTDAGFYSAGSSYKVMIVAAAVDGKTQNPWVGLFTIEKSAAFYKADLNASALITANAALVIIGNLVDSIDTDTSNTYGLMTGTGAVTYASLTVSGATAFSGAVTAAHGSNDIRVDARKLGGTTQTGRDVGLSVLISSGISTGQLDVTSGVVKANLSQWLGSIPNILNGGNVQAIVSSPGDSSGVTTLLSRIGGSLTISGGAVTVGTNNDKTGYSLTVTPPTAAAIATAIWTDTTAGDFTAALSIGKSVLNGVALGTGLTIATATNLTNAPTNGDLTAVMKTSVGTAVATGFTNFLASTIDETQTGATVMAALAAARAQGIGKWAIVGTDLVIYRSDNTTPLVTLPLAPTAAAPTSRG